MRQVDLFDPDESQRRKDDGMRRAAIAHPIRLETARQIATTIALSRMSREVTADDVGHRLASLGYEQLGPEAGALFKTRCWEFTGKRIKSNRIKNHAREVKVWYYIP